MDPKKLKESVGRKGYTVVEIRAFLQEQGIADSKSLARPKDDLIEMALKIVQKPSTEASPKLKKKSKSKTAVSLAAGSRSANEAAVSAAAPPTRQSPQRSANEAAAQPPARQSPRSNLPFAPVYIEYDGAKYRMNNPRDVDWMPPELVLGVMMSLSHHRHFQGVLNQLLSSIKNENHA